MDFNDRQIFQRALATFNSDKPNWFNWEKIDSGNPIKPEDRIQYKYIKVVVSGATIPSESDLNAKIKEIKDADAANILKRTNDITSGKNKLKNLGLSDDEIKALMGA